MQKGVDAVADNGTVTLISDITSSRETFISKPVVIEGGNHVLTTTTQFVANDKDNSVIEINSTSAVNVSNLVVDGTGGNYLNGVNSFKSTATLNNLTLKNNDKYGMVVNGSSVTVNNITTSSNNWGGINVDVSSTTNPARLTVNGKSAHSEYANIYMDDTTRKVEVADTNSQYTFGPSGIPGRPNDRVYRLIPDTQGPAIGSKNPAKNEVIGGSYKVSAVVTDPSGVDDESVYAKFRDDSGKEYVHYLKREPGTDIFSKVVNTATIINKKVGNPSRVSFFARDSNGTSRSSVSDGVVIDNAGPSIFNKIPAENQHIRGLYKVSATVTDFSGVDDSSVYARFRDNTGKEYTYTLSRETGTDTFSATVDTTKIGDGNTNPNRVSFFARDEFGTSRSSVSDGVVIDNAAPRVSNIKFSREIDGNISGTVDITFDLTDASKIDFGQTKLLFADGPNDKFRDRESSKYTPVSTGGNSYKVTVNTRDFVKQGHDGTYNLQFNLRDELGNNTSTKPAEFRSMLVDNAGPSIANKKPAEGATINGNKYVASAVVTDPSGVDPESVYVRFRDDSGKEYTTYLQKQNDEGLYSAEVDTTKIGDGNTGPNRVSFFARDGFGTSRSSVSDGVRIDNAAPASPSATFTADNDGDAVANGGTTDSMNFTFDLSNSDADGVDHYELKYWNDIEGSAFKENTPWNKKDIPSSGEYKDNFTQGEGTHYFSFIACDEVNNCSSDPTVFEVTYATNETGGGNGTGEGGNGEGEGDEDTSTDPNDGNNADDNTNVPATGSSGNGPTPAANRSNTTRQTSTTSTPGAISPLAQVAFNQGVTGADGSAATGSVLGATTDRNESGDDTTGEVLGTESPSTDSSVKSAAVAQSPEGWKLFGIAWYWILLLLAALAALWWFLVARRRNAEEDANL